MKPTALLAMVVTVVVFVRNASGADKVRIGVSNYSFVEALLKRFYTVWQTRGI
jgi:hypothetical protein